MPTNDFIGFASSGSANIASQADYAAAAEQGIGMQPGPASSKLANKAWRQGANMAAAIGQMIVDAGYNALDNGDIAALKTALLNGLASRFLAGFETGTFTPTIFGGTVAGVFTYTNQTGNYVKFGPLCYVDLRVDGKVVTAPSGNVDVGGLPYIASSGQQSLLINQCSATMNYAPFMIRLSGSLAQGNLFGVNTNNQSLVAINFTSGLAVDTVVNIRACGIYRVA